MLLNNQQAAGMCHVLNYFFLLNLQTQMNEIMILRNVCFMWRKKIPINMKKIFWPVTTNTIYSTEVDYIDMVSRHSQVK